MSLQLEQVSWSVQARKIVSEVSLEAASNEFVGLIGPNGSGKSSLLRTIYRVLPPDTGVIRLDTTNVWHLSVREAAQRTAVVAQEHATEFDFTVEEFVLMGRTPHKGVFEPMTEADERIVAEALRRVNVQALAGRNFQTLSGGEKQRVVMARALAQQPRCLVLDEPTNHLDIRYQIEVLELVKGLGITTLAALHDLNLAATYCDRLYVLNAGEVVAAGPPAQVLQPDLIAQVYGVHAEVEVRPGTGRLNTSYCHIFRNPL